MQSFWLNRKNNKKLIVFFSGWGSDEKLFKHLDCEDFDVYMLCDYRDFERDFPDFSDYSEKYLIGWSTGVYVCNMFFDVFKDFDKFIAVNGTQDLIDDNFGIPKQIWKLTVDNFNELSCRKFMSKISNAEIFKNYAPRSTEELKAELVAIEKQPFPESAFNFNTAYVSTKDRIIPAKNQIAWWESAGVDIVEIDAPHYVFDRFSKWSELL